MSASVKTAAGAGAKPWWIGGTEDRGQWNQLPNDVTAEGMLRLAGINYNVSKVPMYAFASPADYHAKKMTLVPGVFGITRTEPDGSISLLPNVSVGADYAPIQVREAFAFGDDLINASTGGAHWHTAGELLDGTVWALAKLDKEIYVAGDQIETFLLMTTRHDGKSSFTVKLTDTRVVCKNTLNMSMRNGTPRSWATRHTAEYKGRMEEARKILQLTTKAHAEWEKLALKLLDIPIKMKTQDFNGLMEHLFPVPENLKGVDNVNDARIRFARVLHKDDLANIKDTGWGIVNAAADYEQHFKQIRSNDPDKIVETLFKRSFESDSKNSLVTKAKEFVLAL